MKYRFVSPHRAPILLLASAQLMNGALFLKSVENETDTGGDTMQEYDFKPLRIHFNQLLQPPLRSI